MFYETTPVKHSLLFPKTFTTVLRRINYFTCNIPKPAAACKSKICLIFILTKDISG